MKNILISVFLLCSISAFSQDLKTKKYAFSGGVGSTMILHKALVGSAGVTGKTSYEFGFQFYMPLKKKLFFITGLSWHTNEIKVTSGAYPDIDQTPKYYKLSLLYSPLFIQVNFAKHLFFQTGLLIDIDISNNSYITNQSGIGSGLGLGAYIPLSKKLDLQIEYFINVHGIILIKGENYPERVLDNGLKIGIAF